MDEHSVISRQSGKASPLRKRQRVDARKGTACGTCRRLKIKCDSADRGAGSCSRCLRLDLKCVSEKKVWINAESPEKRPQPYNVDLIKLERALEDVLEKLNMPALELYAQREIVQPSQSPRQTRQNSPEPTRVDNGDERDLSPGPMGSLIEATRLSGLRSQLRSAKQRRKGGMRRMYSDLISESILSEDEAEKMLELSVASFPLMKLLQNVSLDIETNSRLLTAGSKICCRLISSLPQSL